MSSLNSKGHPCHGRGLAPLHCFLVSVVLAEGLGVSVNKVLGTRKKSGPGRGSGRERWLQTQGLLPGRRWPKAVAWLAEVDASRRGSAGLWVWGERLPRLPAGLRIAGSCAHAVVTSSSRKFLNPAPSYTQNGILHMLDRNKRIKPRPERFQNCKDLFDLILTCEERVYDQVVEGECRPAAASSSVTPVPPPHRIWEPARERRRSSIDSIVHVVALVPEGRLETGLGPGARWVTAQRVLHPGCSVPPAPAMAWCLGRKWSEARSARAHRAGWVLRPLTSASFCPGQI